MHPWTCIASNKASTRKKCKKWSNLLSAFSLPVQHTACTRLANILMVDADCPAGEVITRTSVYNAAAG